MNNKLSTQASAIVLAVLVTASTMFGVDQLAQREYADNAVGATTDVAVQQVIITAQRPARG